MKIKDCLGCGKSNQKVEFHRGSNYCKKCYNKDTVEKTKQYYHRNAAKKRKETEELYNYYSERMKKLPNKPMTEEEWQAACRYFDGCAWCGKPLIETRHLLIKYKDGGSYAKYNMLPSCAPCASKWANRWRPFYYLGEPINYVPKKRFLGKERTDKILSWIDKMLEEAENEYSNSNNDSEGNK